MAAQDRFKESDQLDEFISLFGIGDGGGGPKEEHLERALLFSDMNPTLCSQIISKLDTDWSPEQIAGRFRKEGISKVSCQTIYNWLYRDRQAGGHLYRKLRRKRAYRAHKTKATHIQGRTMIDKRPAIVDSRSRQGDWELDSVISCKGDSTIIVTAVERKSRFLVASLLPDRNALRLARRVCRME